MCNICDINILYSNHKQACSIGTLFNYQYTYMCTAQNLYTNIGLSIKWLYLHVSSILANLQKLHSSHSNATEVRMIEQSSCEFSLAIFCTHKYIAQSYIPNSTKVATDSSYKLYTYVAYKHLFLATDVSEILLKHIATVSEVCRLQQL